MCFMVFPFDSIRKGKEIFNAMQQLLTANRILVPLVARRGNFNGYSLEGKAEPGKNFLF